MQNKPFEDFFGREDPFCSKILQLRSMFPAAITKSGPLGHQVILDNLQLIFGQGLQLGCEIEGRKFSSGAPLKKEGL